MGEDIIMTWAKLDEDLVILRGAPLEATSRNEGGMASSGGGQEEKVG